MKKMVFCKRLQKQNNNIHVDKKKEENNWVLKTSQLYPVNLNVSLNVFIAYIKQGVGPQVFPTLVMAIPLNVAPPSHTLMTP